MIETIRIHKLANLELANLSTTTMGDSLPVVTIKPFQIISADETIMPKLRTWYKIYKVKRQLHLVKVIPSKGKQESKQYLSLAHARQLAQSKSVEKHVCRGAMCNTFRNIHKRDPNWITNKNIPRIPAKC